MKATAIAPSNIAFIKYWGKKNEKLRLPANGSISVNLNNLLTTTTVEFSPEREKDLIIFNKNTISAGRTQKRVITHLDRIRNLAGINYKAKTVTETNFPDAAGLASSASGFAAMTVAAASSSGLNLSEKELTILARVASGSACRSIPDGFVEWIEGNSNESSYANSVFPPEYWKIDVIAVILSREKKEVSSSQGHKAVGYNPFFKTRLATIAKKIKDIKKYIKERQFVKFGELIEREALELNAMAITSNPPIIYWYPETIKLIKLIHEWRKEGMAVFFSIDAGPNMFIFSETKNTNNLLKNLKLNNFKDFVINQPARGTRLINQHLF